MRIVQNLLTICFISVLFFSCGKDASFDQAPVPNSVGSLAKDASSNCLPSSVSGNYIVDTTLNATNYLVASVNVSSTGSYKITTDSRNGYSFSSTGVFTDSGVNNIKLVAIGKPANAGVDVFKLSYNETTCYIPVTVTSSATKAAYTLNCSGATINGTYTAETAVNSTNTISLPITVSTTGGYTITTNAANNIAFAAAGTFTTTGSQKVTLIATGTPTAAGPINYTITAGTNTCSQTVTFAAPAPPSAYIFNCSGFTETGSYALGTALTSADTISASVNVTTVGAYTISTNSVSGISFSVSGVFTNLGTQTVTLAGSGTPTGSGSTSYTITGGTNTCSVSINITAPASAVFTFAGAPSACTLANVNGTYTAQTALTSSNAVAIQVNVTTKGAFSIQTNTQNGISFSAVGSFTSTGVQNVILNGTGTPTAAGTVSFTPTATGVTGCSFSVTIGSGVVQPSPYSCNLNGVYTDFSSNSSASTLSGFNVSGLNSADGSSFTIVLILQSGTVHTGTYSSNGSIVTGAYTDASNATLTGGVGLGSFTLNITTLTSTNVQGTFSGTLTNSAKTKTITVTNGVLNLPL